MGSIDLQRLRNIGIVAHIDAGKTTVSERILHASGVEHRVGQVDEGTAVLDWMAEERERGITITAAATTVPWGDAWINLIDTPGHVDFTVEVERALRVLDGAVLVLDAVMGVQAQSETVWRQMERHGVPCIAFANKCDRAGADVLGVCRSIHERLGARAIPIQYPLGGTDARALVDLLSRATWDFSEEARAREGGPRAEDRPWPEDVADELEVLRSELIDVLAEEDEALIAAVLEDREPELEDLKRALRRRVVEGSLVPVLCGAALRDFGVPPILDAVVDYLPSPLDRPPTPAQRLSTGRKDRHAEGPIELPCEPAGPLAMLAFKLHAGPHGDLTFVRLYSGRVEAGQQVMNARHGKKERVARILRMHAESGEALESAEAGDIVALTGLKWTGTGDTLCERGEPLLLESLDFPDPVMTLVAEPTSSADRDKLRQSLERLAHEDPSLRVRENADTGQWHVAGMGELHLEVVQHRLRDEFKLSPRFGEPRVAYREAVERTGKGAAKVDRTVGGKDVFGAVELELLADPEALAPVVEWAPGCPVPAAQRPVVEEALRLEAQVGPRFGFALVHARIRVTGGESRDHDAEVAFSQAGTQALRQAMGEAGIVLLEPVMAFEVQAPAEFASGIIADLNGRRANMQDVLSDGDLRTLRGEVPLSAMFGYASTVRSLSQGRAGYALTPAGYRPVPERELEARGLVWT